MIRNQTGFTAMLFAMCFATAASADITTKTLGNGFTYITGGEDEPEPGVWDSRYTLVMEKAITCRIPVAVFFSKTSCSRCKNLEHEIISLGDEFTAWAKSRGYLLLFGMLGEGEFGKTLALIQNGTALPQCGVWWDKDGDGNVDVGNKRMTTWTGVSAKSAVTFMSNADKWLGEYSPISCNIENGVLTSIEIHDGTDSFYFTTPSGVTSIGCGVFASSGLKRATISSSVESIGDGAFANCDKLTSLTFGGNAPTVGVDAFSGVSQDCVVYVRPDSSGWGVEIPGVWNGMRIEHLQPRLLIASGVLVSVSPNGNANITVPDSVTRIGSRAFSSDCGCVTNVAIPDSVKVIEDDAFSGCNTLLYDTATITDVKLVDGWAVGYTETLQGFCDLSGLRGIAHGSFEGCSGITGVTMPTGLTSIPPYAFQSSGLTSVTIPSSVTSIGEHAFSGCSAMTSATMSDSVVSVGHDAFNGCNSALYDISTINGVKLVAGWVVGVSEEFSGHLDLSGILKLKIADSALSGGIVTSATISQYVCDYGLANIFDCSCLTSVTLSANVTNVLRRCDEDVDVDAFDGCYSIESFSASPDNECFSSKEGCLLSKDGKTLIRAKRTESSVWIPDGVATIDTCAFSGGASWDCVFVPATVTRICSFAFFYCNVNRLIFDGNAPVVDEEWGGGGVYVRPSSSGWECEIPGEWHGAWIEYRYEFQIEDGVLTRVDLRDETDVKLDIPYGVTRISADAFSECGERLSSVIIPDSVTHIAANAFDGCDRLWANWYKSMASNYASETAGAVNLTEISLTVTNVVVHYVTQSVPSAAVTPAETTGIVNVIAEVTSGGPVAIASTWAEQYPGFETKFGNNFSAAVTKPTGKHDGAGNAMLVWQDFVAGTDPTNPNDVFTASITFNAEGKPIISWTPELPEAEAAKRSYKTYGKVQLTDSDWTLIADDADSYNFFRVTVEMK